MSRDSEKVENSERSGSQQFLAIVEKSIDRAKKLENDFQRYEQVLSVIRTFCDPFGNPLYKPVILTPGAKFFVTTFYLMMQIGQDSINCRHKSGVSRVGKVFCH